MRDKDRALLADILQHGVEALGYLKDVSLTEYRKDRRLQLVTERLLEIVGEAAGVLSEEARAQVEFDWQGMRGLRNVISHQYGFVNHERLYKTATTRLPGLLKVVQKALG